MHQYRRHSNSVRFLAHEKSFTTDSLLISFTYHFDQLLKKLFIQHDAVTHVVTHSHLSLLSHSVVSFFQSFLHSDQINYSFKNNQLISLIAVREMHLKKKKKLSLSSFDLLELKQFCVI